MAAAVHDAALASSPKGNARGCNSGISIEYVAPAIFSIHACTVQHGPNAAHPAIRPYCDVRGDCCRHVPGNRRG